MTAPSILVVEDDAAHAELIGLAFEPDEDFHLRLAPSLREAREAIAETRPELVITDLLLPDGRGTDLLPPQGQSEFPIVVMTLSLLSTAIIPEAARAASLFPVKGPPQQRGAFVVGPRDEDSLDGLLDVVSPRDEVGGQPVEGLATPGLLLHVIDASWLIVLREVVTGIDHDEVIVVLLEGRNAIDVGRTPPSSVVR